MPRRLFTVLAALVVLIAAGASRPAAAQSFYEGKTIRVSVGLAPGGGYDTYAWVIARHLGKHVPGTPTVIVENMPGAGSLISANHLFKVAKPDGLTVGKFSGTLFLGQVLPENLLSSREKHIDQRRRNHEPPDAVDHLCGLFTHVREPERRRPDQAVAEGNPVVQPMTTGTGQSLSAQDDLVRGESAAAGGQRLLNGLTEKAGGIAELEQVTVLVAARSLPLSSYGAHAGDSGDIVHRTHRTQEAGVLRSW